MSMTLPILPLSSIVLAEPVLTDQWVTPAFISHTWGYSLRMVHKWCHSGFLVRRGYVVHQDQRRRWWIKIPDNPQPGPRHIN